MGAYPLSQGGTDPTGSVGPSGKRVLDLENLSGPQIQIVVATIKKSFNEDQFAMLLTQRLEMKLDELAASGRPYPERIFQVVEESQRKGFGRQLIEAIEAELPNVERVKTLRDKIELARLNVHTGSVAPPHAVAASAPRAPDIFISYAREQFVEAKSLADDLTASGYTVLWDHKINAGTKFRLYIKKRIAAANAVIVIWSDDAVESDWVNGEAGEAKEQDKYIPVKIKDFDERKISFEFRAYHTAELDDRPGVLRAILDKVGAMPPQQQTLSPQEPNPLSLKVPEPLPSRENRPVTLKEPELELRNEPGPVKGNTFAAFVTLAVIAATAAAVVWLYWQQPKPSGRIVVCVADRESNCQEPHDIFYGCTQTSSLPNEDKIAAKACQSEPKSIHNVKYEPGGWCGYWIIEVDCS